MHANTSRRRMLELSGAAALLSTAVLGATKLPRTPAQTSGPFYPLQKPLDVDADLTRVKGRAQRAAGQVVHVMGRVLNVSGEPVAGARIELWQANSHGRYTHPNDGNSSAPLDPNFEGYADFRSDDQGRYRFMTIKPGAYPAGNGMRPPHIHFGVTGRKERLVTQMYFPGEKLNEDDFVIATAGRNHGLLVATLVPGADDVEPGAWLARWDIVLENG
jgi:protocatechuate 3,4-dioxygenase, beta subunit